MKDILRILSDSDAAAMLEDRIVPGHTAARISSGAHLPACSDSVKPSALEEEVVSLFDQLEGRLLRYLLSLGLPASDGEEIIQEVFLALFKHLQRGRPRHNLRAWAFQVAHNLALKQRTVNHWNRQNLLEYGGASSEDAFVNPSLTPEDELARSQRHARLFGVLKALPEQDRRCISLRAEGLTYREIAQILDMSLGSVSLSLARSLSRFARADAR